MHLSKSFVVCLVAVVICGCDRSQPTPPATTKNAIHTLLARTRNLRLGYSFRRPIHVKPNRHCNNPTPVELPDSTNSIGMQFKLVPAGSFTMVHRAGNRQAPPQLLLNAPDTYQQVTLTQPFHLGVYEVTQEQYERVMGKNPSKFKGPNVLPQLKLEFSSRRVSIALIEGEFHDREVTPEV